MHLQNRAAVSLIPNIDLFSRVEIRAAAGSFQCQNSAGRYTYGEVCPMTSTFGANLSGFDDADPLKDGQASLEQNDRKSADADSRTNANVGPELLLSFFA